jgi:ubiquitin carboxyl-terminal hydrolase 34
MHPYTIASTTDDEHGAPDMFELVGVLVHSGTAESGHYYSYTRERPSARQQQSWVEFNDEVVTQWDISGLETCCFGGSDLRPDGESGFEKSYSAYMLFYQRTSSLPSQISHPVEESTSRPIRATVPNRLASVIAIENELTLRKYCLYDPSQTVFMSRMLASMRKFNDGACTVAHDREKSVLHTALNHLDQVVARTKDLPQFAAYLNNINRVCQSCAECSRDYIDWFCQCSEALRMLVLRNPDAAVRSDIANSALAALKKIKADATYAYGFDDDANDMDAPPQMIMHFADGLLRLFDTFHMNTRAWPEYFGLLNDIAHLGQLEATVLLDRDFLRKILLIICADPLLPMDPQFQKMWANITKRMATRPVSYGAIVALLCRLLEACDQTSDPISVNGNRLSLALEGETIPLTQGERHLLVQQWTRSESNILVEKLLRIDQNDFAVQTILKWLLKWSNASEEMVDESIYRAIVGGLQSPPIGSSPKPYLRAAYTYCECVEETDTIRNTIADVSRVALNDNAAGIDYVNFFKEMLDLGDIRGSPLLEDEIICAIVDNVGFWAPNLLTSYELQVRSSTEALVRELVLDREDEVGLQEGDDMKTEVDLRAIQTLSTSCLDFMQETYLRQGVAAVQTTLLNMKVVLHECSTRLTKDDQFHNRYEGMFHVPVMYSTFTKVRQLFYLL